MALTDRAAANLLNAARIASNQDIASPATVANQMDQRHVMLSAQVVVTALTAGSTYRFCGFVADRAYKVISARVITPAAITANGTTSYVTFAVVANNDAGGADTTLATLAVQTTSTVANQSTALVVQTTNAVASGQQVDMLINPVGETAPAGTANAPYVIDLVVQEV